MLTGKQLLNRISRPAELVLAAVFLAGALLKAYDINLFVLQISFYGVLSGRFFMVAAAIGTVALETVLALALVLKIRLRGLTHAGILALLGVFTGLIIYGWKYHGLKDCGCFGPIEISPGASIAKNVVIALLALAAWLGMSADGRGWAFRRAVRLSPVLILAAAAVGAFSYATVRAVPPPDSARFAKYVFTDETGKVTDLGKGEYLVVVLSMGCLHCMESVPAINDLLYEPGMPETVGLCYEPEDGDLEEFRDTTGTEFPLFSLGSDVIEFFSLIDKEPPRFALVRDGVQIHFWDYDVPTADEVVAALRGKTN